MGRADPRMRLASILEKCLPPVEAIHSAISEAGFNAWQVFVEERLALVDENERSEELRLLLLSCREEFCNFAHYTRNTGGDDLSIPELDERRKRLGVAGPSSPAHLLQSDRRMSRDISLGMQYAAVTRRRAAAAIVAERGRYEQLAAAIMRERPDGSIEELLALSFKCMFKKCGFSSENHSNFSLVKDIGCYSVQVNLDNSEKIGRNGWDGDVSVSFFIKPKSDFQGVFHEKNNKKLNILPLRLSALVPGSLVYSSGMYFFDFPEQGNVFGNVVIIRSYEHSSSKDDAVKLISHANMSFDFYGMIYSYIEKCMYNSYNNCGTLD